jgi:hypothetical protein
VDGLALPLDEKHQFLRPLHKANQKGFNISRCHKKTERSILFSLGNCRQHTKVVWACTLGESESRKEKKEGACTLLKNLCTLLLFKFNSFPALCFLFLQSCSESECSEPAGSHSFSSLAILEAIFLNPIDVPEMRLKRTPFRERRGSLHTYKFHRRKEK